MGSHLPSGLIASAIAISFASIATGQTDLCPAFHAMPLAAKINSADRAARFDGGMVAIIKELRIDTDGASTAYHPENIGTSHLCNGMNPYVEGRCLGTSKQDLAACYGAIKQARRVKWSREKSPTFCVYGIEVRSAAKAHGKLLWGGPFGDGPIPLQSNTDPAPGFFISTTALPLPLKAGASPLSAYADADRVPYVVVPTALTGKFGPTELLAGASIVDPKTSHPVAALVADVGKAVG
jgi:hypothetical protein